MRIRTIILILAIIQASTAFAQTQWVQPGAEWHYDYITVSNTGCWTWTYEKDTVLNSINCQMLLSTNYELEYFTGRIIKRNYQAKNFIYNSGDTVFWYVNGNFEILYNFAAYSGYSWDLGLDSSDHCERAVVTVGGKSTRIIDGVTFDYYSASVPQNSSHFYDHMIERMGSLFSLFPWSDGWCDTNDTSVPEYPGYHLHCYTDDVNGRIDRGWAWWNHSCHDIYYLDINEHHSNAPRVFPNPVSDILYIDGLNDAFIRIFDIIGNLIYAAEARQEIDVSEFQPGLYLLSVQQNDEASVNLRFIKE